MSEKKDLELKTIKEILDKKDIETNNFYIPSYQRGYRWGKQQVQDLLDDIYEFASKQKVKDEFYCLQPVVVLFDEEEKRYKVLDGQQRLTTIYIILKYLEKETYSISYETREENTNSKEFLKTKLTQGKNYENPDFYYMSNAYETIKEWFKNKNKKLFLDTLLNDTKVIWYEVQATTEKEEIDIFTRLNMGKISLTNAELIKAMLLIPIKDYKEQIEFSTIWDKMELTLQNNEFWYFLSNEKKTTTTIDLIFDTLADKYNEDFNLNISKQDDKFSFYIFDCLIKSNTEIKKKKTTTEAIWEDVQEIYRYFIDWYNDREMYHKIGYLINREKDKEKKKKDVTYKPSFFITSYKSNTKDTFKSDILDKEIKETIKNVKVLDELSYGDDYVHRVLLLFSIETVLINQESNQRFQFDKYKDESWDIEHIASQTDNSILGANREKWLNAINEYYKKIDNIDELKTDDTKFQQYFDAIKKDLQIEDDVDKDNIGNLTLLNASINRSYGNAFFPIKRAIIIDKGTNGSFIPQATKNVFLKQYSKRLSDMMNWTNNDIEAYRANIYELLKKYGVKDTKVENE